MEKLSRKPNLTLSEVTNTARRRLSVSIALLTSEEISVCAMLIRYRHLNERGFVRLNLILILKGCDDSVFRSGLLSF